jgi:hypothetical protein
MDPGSRHDPGLIHGDLSWISFLGIRKIDKKDLSTLRHFQRLRSLDLNFTGISDEYVCELPRIRRLQELELQDNPELTDASIPALVHKFPYLRHLDLRRTGVTDESFKFLGSLSSLEQLLLAHTQITGEQLDLLTKGCPRLRVLVLEDTGVTDGHVACVSQFQYLQEINLAKTQVTDKLIVSLSQVKSLERVTLWDVSISPVTIAQLRRSLPNARITYKERDRDC